MKYALSISAALLLAMSQVQPSLAQNGANDLVKQAIAAEGGADALRALKRLAIKGEAKFWEPEQSEKAGGEPRFLGDATFTVTWDLAKGMARTDWDRDQKYPDPPVKLKYTELVKATDGPKSVAAMGNQKLGKQSLPAVSFMDNGSKFTILFDSKTHLPAAIRTRDDDNIHGDSDYDLVLGDWKAVGGVKLAHSLSYQLNGVEVAKLTYKDVSANPMIAADAFAAPDAVKSAAKGPATSNVPYQWVLRRLFLTRFVDSDSILYPPGGGLKLVELAPNVQQVQGGSANNLIVAMKDHLVIFDAPYGELQSRWVIDAAKEKYPGKPIKYLVLTHHHMDHTGGTRTYIAEGAQVIVPSPDKAHFEKVARAPHTVAPDELQKKPQPAKIVEVKDQMTLKDDVGEIRLYNIPNPHAQGMIIGHVAKDNIVWVTDLVSPRGAIERTPGTVAVGEALRKYGVTDATIAGGHGTTAKQADIAPALGQN